MTSPKRILFITPPGAGHAFPLVYLAWAMRTMGHEVLVGTSGVSLGILRSAGLSVVNTAPGVDLEALYARFKPRFAESFPIDQDSTIQGEKEDIFAVLDEITIDTLLGLARDWRTDIVVHTPEARGGPVIANKLGVPDVFLGVGFGTTPEAMARTLSPRMKKTAERLGTNCKGPTVWIDVVPPSLRAEPTQGWPMRGLPYNGGSVSNTLAPVPSRTRVAITFGTVIPALYGLSGFRRVIEAAADVDAEFVIAHGSPQGRELHPLPKNVTEQAWVGLDVLLATCQGIVHHGGSGTTLTALHAGIPQLLLPQGADQFYNARVLSKRGVGLADDHTRVTAQSLNLLITDSSMRATASSVRQEIQGMPAPSEVAARILTTLFP